MQKGCAKYEVCKKKRYAKNEVYKKFGIQTHKKLNPNPTPAKTKVCSKGLQQRSAKNEV
jgi:hypothetical protein